MESYNGPPVPTMLAWMILIYNLISVAQGVLVALLGYLADSLLSASVRNTILAGLVTYQLVDLMMADAPRDDGSTTYVTCVCIAACVGAILIDRWCGLNAALSLFCAITIYWNHLTVLACATILLDGPPRDSGVDLIHPLLFTRCHFVTVTLLFYGKTIYKHAVANIWNWSRLPLLLLWHLVVLEFLRELSERRTFSTGLTIAMVYDSWAAVRETWETLGFAYCEYRARFFHFFRKQWRRFLEILDTTALDFDELLAFDYSTVPIQQGEIRLLYMSPRSWNPFADGLLRVGLVAVPLERTEGGERKAADEWGYEALSYTWGAQDVRRPILINGMRFDISETMHEMLHARRSFLRGRHIWVDGLCINQEDGEERTEQVLHMRKIYMRASRVVAWLGASFDADMAAHTLLELSYKVQTERARPDWLLPSNRRSPQWRAFVKVILQNPYFSRAWILQETGLGFDLQFYIGGAYILPEFVWYAFQVILQPEVQSTICRESGLLENNDLDGVWNWFHAFFLRPSDGKQRPDESATHPLGLVLSWSARLQATNPRDKVYAMLGVSNSAVANSIRPVYEEDMTPTKVFQSTAIALLLSDEDAEYVFPHAGVREPNNTKPDLPTWAPDWEHEVTRRRQLLSRHPLPGMQKIRDLQDLGVDTDMFPILTNSRYTAGGGADFNPAFEIDNSLTKLSTLAVLVDKVHCTTEPYNPLDLNKAYHARWVLLAQILNHNNRASDDDETALARALIADRRIDTPDLRSGDPASLRKAYRAFSAHFPFAKPLDALPVAQLRSVLNPDAQAEANAYAGEVMLGWAYASQFRTSCGGRRLCATTEGRLALVPEATRAKDVFAVIPGLQTPYVLRLWRDGAAGKEYQLVGECYLDGVMNGEVGLGRAGPVVLV